MTRRRIKVDGRLYEAVDSESPDVKLPDWPEFSGWDSEVVDPDRVAEVVYTKKGTGIRVTFDLYGLSSRQTSRQRFGFDVRYVKGRSNEIIASGAEWGGPPESLDTAIGTVLDVTDLETRKFIRMVRGSKMDPVALALGAFSGRSVDELFGDAYRDMKEKIRDAFFSSIR